MPLPATIFAHALESSEFPKSQIHESTSFMNFPLLLYLSSGLRMTGLAWMNSKESETICDTLKRFVQTYKLSQKKSLLIFFPFFDSSEKQFNVGIIVAALLAAEQTAEQMVVAFLDLT